MEFEPSKMIKFNVILIENEKIFMYEKSLGS